GRAVGCALGKPSELIGLARDAEGRSIGRSLVKTYLERRGDWPLSDYFSGRDLGDGLGLWCPDSQRENIRFMEPDDDIHYTLVALGCIEQHGPTFEWSHVARYWLDHLPIFSICTAEAQAIETFQRHSTRPGDWHCWATPELTRRHRNPYREWIGAQIRADGWAWVAAGKPELAAELAYRDACWTHERNGIYGEMMFAAIQAAAFVEHDPRRLVEIGLSEIPTACRLATLVRELLSWIDLSADFEACMDRLEAELAGVYPVHTLDNALICILSLFYGRMDTERSISTSVMCGHDTDCNGATVGSIVGAARGRRAFGGSLAARLNDIIKPSMIGIARRAGRTLAGAETSELTMTDLAARTLEQFRLVDAYHRAKRLC
ncbi:MAG: ADP-ribosylglycohydrolase family protein, partial [Myxococcales bacterium]|nr:ADP-ribosylglycohydrolase family protein [Myxococcales bacterium]